MHDGALQGTWYVLYDENGNISGYAPAMELIPFLSCVMTMRKLHTALRASGAGKSLSAMRPDLTKITGQE